MENEPFSSVSTSFQYCPHLRGMPYNSEDSTTAELFDSYITFPDNKAVLKEKSCVRRGGCSFTVKGSDGCRGFFDQRRPLRCNNQVPMNLLLE